MYVFLLFKPETLWIFFPFFLKFRDINPKYFSMIDLTFLTFGVHKTHFIMAKAKSGKPTHNQPQSAVTGKFVTQAYADKHPKTTFTENHKNLPKKK